MERRTLTIVAIVAVAAVVSLALGVIIGYFGKKDKSTEVENPLNQFYASLVEQEDDSFNQKLINEIDANRIRNHLRAMTNVSHMAGTPGDLNSANYVYDAWRSQNLDYVKKIDYDVLLAFPDPDKPNSFGITNAAGVTQTTDIVEAAFDPELGYSYIPRPFLAYSIKGTHTSDKVYYGNYCTLDDFLFLKAKGTDLTDSIVLCRYGLIFRGNKVKLAAQYGAKGVLIYEDPIRGAPAGEKPYPDGIFLPGDGMQRGSLFTGNGDPLTPLYPSTKYAYKLKESESSELPTIVAQVIGYDHAKIIFQMIEGLEEVKPEWKGGLDVQYTYGGKLKDNQKLTVNVYSERKVLTTYNVIGVIKGETEPDRYVMVGNHRDAWVLGAIDPTSGTASLLEISRALNELKRNKGWKPKRSIVFLSWGAEEFGLIGSTEWVEEFQKKLGANGVAYLNIDIAVQGNFSYIAKSTPLLFDLILNVTKTVKLTDTQTVYDRWLEYAPNADRTKPAVSSTLGSGSDFMGFQQRLGLACVDSTFTQNSKQPQYTLLGSSYPTYHSSFETFRLVDTMIDPGFKSFKAISTVVAELARRLSDSLILPFNVIEYAKDMDMLLADLKAKYNNVLAAQNIAMTGLEVAIKNYGNAARKFQDRLSRVNKMHFNEIRQYNDQLKDLEKAFLDASGRVRNGYLHMLQAPSLYNSYGGDGFPALVDAIFNAQQEPTNSNWVEVEKQLSIAAFVVNSASIILDESHTFEREF